jgi:putative NADPH-quinone reductase
MKVLLVFAHPEPRSLNGALRDVAIKGLQAQGHEVQMSDLYAERWKSEVDRADFPSLAPDQQLKPAAASKAAYAANALTEDVRTEIEKLLWADALILQFPLWWFSMPAILKGWVDRVYASGFAYRVWRALRRFPPPSRSRDAPPLPRRARQDVSLRIGEFRDYVLHRWKGRRSRFNIPLFSSD